MSAQDSGIDRQQSVLTAIGVLLDNAQEPTQKRIMLLTGIKDAMTITRLTNKLHERGYIIKQPRKKGAIILTEKGEQVCQRLK